jgi:uncharacterized protein YbjQ (UPF0145 family)
MGQILLEFLDWIFLFVLLAVGYVCGVISEKRHYKSIREREKQFSHVLAFGSKWPPTVGRNVDSALVTGSVVISADYFKTFVGGLRKLVGGRFRGYETLMDRARREAILRMKEEADRLGADMVFNFKCESSQIGGRGQGGLLSMEVIAYGTALTDRGR